MNPHFFTAPFYFAFIWFRVQGSGFRWRLRRKYTYDDTRSLFSPSFLWKEVPRRGGGWPRETLLPHSGKPTPPRFARLPLPEEGARMIFKKTLIQSLPFAVSDSRFPHICRALLRFPHLSFIPPVPYPPLRGTFPSRRRLRYENPLF